MSWEYSLHPHVSDFGEKSSQTSQQRCPVTKQGNTGKDKPVADVLCTLHKHTDSNAAQDPGALRVLRTGVNNLIHQATYQGPHWGLSTNHCVLS